MDFASDGVIRIENPELRADADAARALLWQQIGLSPDDPASWTRPVCWAADLTGAGPFGRLAGSARLAEALDRVAGPGGWLPRGALGNIPVRFPVPSTVDDRGWHLDLNTPGPDGSWVITDRPHTVLLLTLLSDVGPDDAPTRIRVGSHRDAAAALAGRTVTFEESGPLLAGVGADRPVAYATGRAGDMYLLHPFTVHAADEHRGATPRFMAQAPVLLTTPLTPDSPSALSCAWR